MRIFFLSLKEDDLLIPFNEGQRNQVQEQQAVEPQARPPQAGPQAEVHQDQDPEPSTSREDSRRTDGKLPTFIIFYNLYPYKKK